jgi:type III restriction enzyme
MGFLKKDMPNFVVENLNSKFEVREYQKEAFARFFHCFNNQYKGKETPLHFLFNMATGSGKTLVMAGLILYLYKQGYRNFLFFVNSENIIKKTQDNFLNTLSSKYLFNQKIVFDNKQVSIRPVDNFEDANIGDINICFTTIQKLHSDLHNEKENGLSFSDFKDKDIALLADEAHHGQVKTKKKKDLFSSDDEEDVDDSKPSWENTIERIFQKNAKNLLLEFTATMDFTEKAIAEKYKNKVLYKYDLKEFRNDGYSKDPEILATDTDKKGRILQAIILNQYRQDVAGKYGINLKPVILFKAQKTIEQSKENQELFHSIINGLSIKDIKDIRDKTDVDVLQKCFAFFNGQGITDAILVKKLKDNFAENKCLNVNEKNITASMNPNEKNELFSQQQLLNSLEDKNNQIRAIFAVQKLNEGWDVLNLFDIVRLYDVRGDGRNNKPGKTTISEAQLIGRGARYCSFILEGYESKDRRKFDLNLNHELRILEELHYHSHNESRYISEIKTALIEQGLMDEDTVEVELKLKDSFKETQFYKHGLVYGNERKVRSYEGVQSISDLGVSKKNITFSIQSGLGEESGVFTDKEILKKQTIKSEIEVKVKDIEKHIIQNALAKNDFFEFETLKKYFPKLESIDQFITNKDFLGGLGINFEGMKKDLENLGNKTKLDAVITLLNEIESQIKSNITEYVGTTEFKPSSFNKIFEDTRIKVKKGSERANGKEEDLADHDWYVFNANYGTAEEKDFVGLIYRQMDYIKKHFKDFYLVRNERQMKIYDFKEGRAFEPDFLFFGIKKNGEHLTYQLFIEPKGSHLAEHDKWKNDFLEELRKNKQVYEFNATRKYKVLGVPFYTSDDENAFKQAFMEVVN